MPELLGCLRIDSGEIIMSACLSGWVAAQRPHLTHGYKLMIMGVCKSDTIIMESEESRSPTDACAHVSTTMID